MYFLIWLLGKIHALPLRISNNEIETIGSKHILRARSNDEDDPLRFTISRYHICAEYGKAPIKSDKTLFVKSSYPLRSSVQSLLVLNYLSKCETKTQPRFKTKEKCASSANYRDYYMNDVTLECFYTKKSKRLDRVRMKNFDFALTASASVDLAIKGITVKGLDTIHASTGKFDPKIFKKLKVAGYITKQTFSVWLNSWQSCKGEIAIECLNLTKIRGGIYIFPLVNSVSGKLDTYAIKMNAIFIVDSKNQRYRLAETSFPVVFDPSISISRMPYSILRQFYELIGVRSNHKDYLVPCENVAHGGGISLSFSGVEIVFPFSDIMVPINTSKDYCIPGFWPGEVPVIGDNFMHALYVVYDREKARLGIALANTEPSVAPTADKYQRITDEEYGTQAPLYSESLCFNVYNVRVLGKERIELGTDFLLRPVRKVKTKGTKIRTKTQFANETALSVIMPPIQSDGSLSDAATPTEDFNSYLFNIETNVTLGNAQAIGIKPVYIPHYAPKVPLKYVFRWPAQQSPKPQR